MYRARTCLGGGVSTLPFLDSCLARPEVYRIRFESRQGWANHRMCGGRGLAKLAVYVITAPVWVPPVILYQGYAKGSSGTMYQEYVKASSGIIYQE